MFSRINGELSYVCIGGKNRYLFLTKLGSLLLERSALLKTRFYKNPIERKVTLPFIWHFIA